MTARPEKINDTKDVHCPVISTTPLVLLHSCSHPSGENTQEAATSGEPGPREVRRLSAELAEWREQRAGKISTDVDRAAFVVERGLQNAIQPHWRNPALLKLLALDVSKFEAALRA